jgi:hypothetical protein
MVFYFRVIVVILLFITIIGESNGIGQCCIGYLREYDHVESCYFIGDGQCCADNVIYSKKHRALIGTNNARIITGEIDGDGDGYVDGDRDGVFDLCRQCFSGIVEC